MLPIADVNIAIAHNAFVRLIFNVINVDVAGTHDTEIGIRGLADKSKITGTHDVGIQCFHRTVTDCDVSASLDGRHEIADDVINFNIAVAL